MFAIAFDEGDLGIIKYVRGVVLIRFMWGEIVIGSDMEVSMKIINSWQLGQLI